MPTTSKHTYTQKMAKVLPAKVAKNKAAQGALKAAGEVEERVETAIHSLTGFVGSVRAVAEVVGPEVVKRTKQKVESLISNMDEVLDKLSHLRKGGQSTAKSKNSPKKKPARSTKSPTTKASPTKKKPRPKSSTKSKTNVEPAQGSTQTT